jgi:transposase
MSKQEGTGKSRKRCSQQYKEEALILAERVGVAEAARQLGLHDTQLYFWRGKVWQKQQRSEVEERLALENARLKRQLADQAEELAILKKAAAYFAKSLK